MGVFAVDDTGVVFSRLVVNCIPNFGHPGASCIDKLNLFVTEQLHLRDARSKGWQNDHIIGLNPAEVFAAACLVFNNIYVHLLESLQGTRVSEYCV